VPDISLYLDEDVRVLLAEVLRGRGYKAVHVLETKRAGKSDEEQFVYAVEHEMALLSHNIKDFKILSKKYEMQGIRHYGIIVSEQIPFKELLRRMLKFLSLESKESIKSRLIWLQDYK
jgi:predicted nuclease of predicted toxin-antitoxin system